MIFDKWDKDLSQVKRWTVESVKFVESRIRELVEKLHHRGIIHGDLKPDNILVRLSDNKTVEDLVLNDFGVSFYEKKDPSYGPHEYNRDFNRNGFKNIWERFQLHCLDRKITPDEALKANAFTLSAWNFYRTTDSESQIRTEIFLNHPYVLDEQIYAYRPI
jgi:serine/threonine protein kinase